MARLKRSCNAAAWSSTSWRERITSSAAAEGVGARRSATKSMMVKSVSWPTGRDYGDFGGGDRAGEPFVVEGGQIFG